ncbi:hypothetical protein [Nostoc sp. FACHB-190]|nr:hypothetical protein [Nostoc sp. FACHB-190]
MSKKVERSPSQHHHFTYEHKTPSSEQEHSHLKQRPCAFLCAFARDKIMI